VNLAAQTAHFVSVNYVFGQKIRSKKKVGGKGENEKINKKGGKGKEKRGGGIMAQL
jgi:hypothetical protein